MKKFLSNVITTIKKSKFWRKTGFWHYVVIFTTALVFCGFYLFLGARGLFVGGDDALFHISRYFSVLHGWVDGQIVPQTDPSFLSGIGHSWNIFYGPLPAHAVAIVFVVIKSWQLAIALAMFLAVFLMGVFVCRFIKDINTKNQNVTYIALLGAIIYIWSPYLIIDLYGRAAIGEVAAFVFLPLVFHGLWRLVNDKKNSLPLLVTGATGLLLSHSLSVVIALVFGLVYIVMNIKKVIPIWKKVASKIFWTLLLVFGLTAFFVLPFLENMGLGIYAINNNWYVENVLYFNAESINNNRLSIINPWLGTRNFGFYLVVTAAAIVAVVTALRKPRSAEKSDVKRYGILLVLATLLTTSLIDWRLVPDFLYTIQFPTRFMGVASLFMAIVAGYGAVWLVNKITNSKIKIVTIIVLILVIIGSGLSRIPWGLDKNVDADNLSTTTNTGLNEYFTMGFLKDGFSTELADSGRLYKTYGDIEVANFEFDPAKSQRTFDVEAQSESRVELSQVYYAGFQATDANGEKLETTYSENGLVEIKIPTGFAGTVTSKFENDTVTNIGLILSLSTFMVALGYAAWKHRK